MSGPDLFRAERDRVILAMWDAGATLEDIQRAYDLSWSRAAHEVNRALNERNGFFAVGNYHQQS